MDLTENDLLEYLRDKQYVEINVIDRSTPLFSSGIIDSMSLLELITFIEDRTGITFEAAEITLENVDTIDAILLFVEHKTTTRTEG